MLDYLGNGLLCASVLVNVFCFVMIRAPVKLDLLEADMPEDPNCYTWENRHDQDNFSKIKDAINPKSTSYRHKPRDQPTSANNNQFERQIKNLRVRCQRVFGAMEFWWFLVMTGIAVMGVVTSDAKFGIIITMEYFRLPSGQLLLRSVVVGSKGLYESARASLIIIQIFTVISVALFLPDINQYNDCQTMFQCFTLALHNGIYGDLSGMHGDNFGDIFTAFPIAVDNKTDLKKFGHWIVVVSYFIIWNFIIAGIIQGQIVDAFSQLREEEEERQTDSELRCLVCSMERFVLDDVEHDGFQVHREKDHNPLHFLFFVVYLQHRDPEEYTGMEAYSDENIKVQDNQWMPVLRCVKKNKEESLEIKTAEAVGEKLTPLNDEISKITSLLNEMENRIMKAIGHSTASNELATNAT